MKKVVLFFLLIFTFCFMSNSVSAETSALPEEINGVITLNENVTLNEKLTIKDNVTIDLNNNILKLTQADNHFNAKVVIQNGTIDISNITHSGDGIIEIGNYGGTSGSLTLNNISFKGDTYSSSYAVFYVYNTSQLNINNSNLTLTNEGSSTGGVIKTEKGKSGEVNIVNTTLILQIL